jgi:hypothetical protein
MSNANFNGVSIGDHAWVNITTSNEVEVHKIPRADGAILRRRGGGLKNITVNAWINKGTRVEVEQYFNQLGGAFTSAVADLIVNGVTYSDCLLQNISQDAVHNKWSNFTVTFLKSGD